MKKFSLKLINILTIIVLVLNQGGLVLAEETTKVLQQAYHEWQYQGALQEAREKVNPIQTESIDERSQLKDEKQGEKQGEVVLAAPDFPLEKGDNIALDLQAKYGSPVVVDNNQKIFQVDATHYITHIGSKIETYQTPDGQEKVIDLNLARNDDGTLSPKGSPVEVNLPSEMSAHEGLEIAYQGKRLEIAPENEVYKHAVVRQHAIRYNGVNDDKDVQYLVTEQGVKEDIILKKWNQEHVFRYVFTKGSYEATLENNHVLVREKGQEKVLFVISAPGMTDKKGAFSQQIRLDLMQEQDRYVVTLDADKAWLASPERVYPVKIDPTITVPTENLIQVTTSTVHGTYQGQGYGYVGYITSAMTGVDGAKDIGRSRMYFAINYDFKKNIPVEARIDKASLNVFQYSRYDHAPATFAAYYLKDAWNPETLDWEKSVKLNQEASGEQSVSEARTGFHYFDIRQAVTNWVQGLSANHGLVVQAMDESAYGSAFYTPYSNASAGGQEDFTPDKAPSLTIHWSIPDPVDINYGINDTSVILRPLIYTTKNGTLQLQGVLADGLATPEAIVGYELNEKSKGFVGLTQASYSYKYPDSSPFDHSFPKGTTRYKDKLGNWQVRHPFTNFDFNTLNQLDARAVSKTGETGQKRASDTFIVYKVSQFDTLPNIANYYGVPLAQVMFDNKVQDMLLVANNTLFIRNPKQNANKPYQPADLPNDEKAKIDRLLMGRGLHCEFGFEPVNLNTGNFYLSHKDVSIADLTNAFEIERHYNSKGAMFNGVFGHGWQFEYAEQLSQDEKGNLNYQRSDGSIVSFEKTSTGYLAPQGYFLTLTTHKVAEKTADFGEGQENYDVVEYHITDSQKNTRIFNFHGLLTAIEDEYANRTVLHYDENYHLRQIVSPSGLVYTFTTREDGKISDIGLPNGSTLGYEYDDNNHLVAYRNANGQRIVYHYNDKHEMVSWVDADGRVAITNTYDDMGRVVKQVDEQGYLAQLDYADHMTTTIDGNGNQTQYLFDEYHRTIAIHYPDDTRMSKTYTAHNQLASYTNELGQTVQYDYDERGNKISEVDFEHKVQSWTYNEQNRPLTYTNAAGVTTTYTYENNHLASIHVSGQLQARFQMDQYDRPLSKTDANGNTTYFDYTQANLTSVTDANGNTTRLDYNAHNQVVSLTNALNQTGSKTYDPEGRPLSETTFDGKTTTYTYDHTGNVIGVTDGNGQTTQFMYNGIAQKIGIKTSTGGTYHYEYDGAGNLLRLTDAENRTTTYTYDKRGRLLSETDAAGDTIHYTYDALGNRVSQTNEEGETITLAYHYGTNQVKSITDTLGKVVTYDYDANGRLMETVFPDGTKENFEYDALGRMTKKVAQDGLTYDFEYDSNGNIIKERVNTQETLYRYDVLNQIIEVVYPNGDKVGFVYDALGHLSRAVDAKGNVTQYEFSGENRLQRVINALGQQASLTYDANGNLESVTDPAGKVSKMGYHVNRQIASKTDANGHTTEYEYNHMEELVRVKDALGNVLSYRYNLKGLPEEITDRNGNAYQFSYTKTGALKTVKAPDESTVTYEHNRVGQVVKESYSSGLEVSYAYNDRSQVVKRSDNGGQEFTYTYDDRGRLSRIKDSLGQETLYTYDAFNRLSQVTYPNQHTRQLTYDELNRLVTETDEEGLVTRYTYDANGNIVSKMDGADREWTYEVNALNQIVKETDPMGAQTAYTYDVLGNVASRTDANGHTETFGYDAIGNPLLYTDKNGNTTIHEYDALNRLMTQKQPNGGVLTYAYDNNGNLISQTNALGHTIQQRYDVLNRLVGQTDPNGNQTTYEYDKTGSLAKIIDALGHETTYENDLYGRTVQRMLPNKAVMRYQYDVLGRLVQVDAPEGKSRTFTYNASGQLDSEIDQAKRKMSYEYDIAGRLTKVTNPLHQSTTYGYDKAGNVISVSSPMGAQTTMRYDKRDRLISRRSPLGKEIAYEYNPMGQVVRSTVNGKKQTRYTYDPNGNLTSVTNPLGDVKTYAYNAMNQLTKVTNEEGKSRTYTYDLAGRLSETADALANRTQFAYDNNGNVTSVVDGANRQVHYQYDALNRLTHAQIGTGGDAKTTRYTYDSVGNLTAVTNGNNQTTQFTYNQLGQLTSQTNALNQTERYDYDQNGRLATLTRADKQTITYDYNQIDKLLSINYEDSAQGQVLYAYDEDGKRVSMSDLTGETNYTYDKDGRITAVRQGDGSLIGYEYDDSGNLVALVYPDGKTVSYTYDELDRLIKVIDRDSQETTYVYDKMGQMVEVRRANQTRTHITYADNGQVLEVINRDGQDKAFSTYRYTYDNGGKIASETRLINGIEETSVYTYDTSGQLASTQVNDKNGNTLGTITYAYDKAGNKISVVKNEQATTYTYNAVNQLVKSEGEDTREYIYDGRGNLIEELKDGEQIYRYAYDVENRLLAVRDKKGLLFGALYDGDHNRVFATNRTEKTTSYQLFQREPEKPKNSQSATKKSPYTKADGNGLETFWYGFTQTLMELFTNSPSATGQMWKDSWEDITRAYHIHIAKTKANQEGIVVNPPEVSIKPGEGAVTYASQVKDVLIPYATQEDTYHYYDIHNYVNDINQKHTQVLMSTDEHGKIKEAYTYGKERINYHDGTKTYQYAYDGRGSVAQTTDSTGKVVDSYTYSDYGQQHSQLNTNNPYQYNAEYVDQATGLQYLRARYDKPNTGQFLTEDSYLGSPFNPLSQNRYTYAENDPINHIDPSGHYSQRGTYYRSSADPGRAWTTQRSRGFVGSFIDLAKKAADKAFTQASNVVKEVALVSSVKSKLNSVIQSAYDLAKNLGHTVHQWNQSKLKEAEHIHRAWSTALEKIVNQFCNPDTIKAVADFAYQRVYSWQKAGKTISDAIGGAIVYGFDQIKDWVGKGVGSTDVTFEKVTHNIERKSFLHSAYSKGTISTTKGGNEIVQGKFNNGNLVGGKLDLFGVLTIDVDWQDGFSIGASVGVNNHSINVGAGISSDGLDASVGYNADGKGNSVGVNINADLNNGMLGLYHKASQTILEGDGTEVTYTMENGIRTVDKWHIFDTASVIAVAKFGPIIGGLISTVFEGSLSFVR